MKNSIKYIMTIIFVFISNKSFAFDYTDTVEMAKDKLMKTDCSIISDECRYYAALEYVAFAKACGVVFSNKTKGTEKDIKEFDIQVSSLLENWKAIEEPKMHVAVLSENNPFKQYLNRVVLEYLMDISMTDLGIECSRIGLIKENKNPEHMSELIQATKNKKKGNAPITMIEAKIFKMEEKETVHE